VRDEIQSYTRQQIQPFGVNPAAVESHTTYAAKLGLPFPLLSDPDLQISGAYGSLKPDGRSIARSVCVIDRDGRVLYAQAGAPGADIVLEHVNE
jgi:thioredoxin-dependent peroxiredoxin